MRLVTVGVITLMLAAVSANAGQGKGRGRGKGGDEAPSATNEAARPGAIVIGETDHRVIREWFASPENLRGLPPGLAKKEKLPPGLQKQLVRNGQLPPGLQKKIQPVPPALERQLTPLPQGVRRVIISGSMVLLDERKNLILDVLVAF